MTEQIFPTRHVLALLRNAPALMSRGCSTLEQEQAYVRLRRTTGALAGDPLLCDARNIALAPKHQKAILTDPATPGTETFRALAAEAEQIPDKPYWTRPHTGALDPEKFAALQAWVEAVEAKYGAEIRVPDITVQAATAITGEEHRIWRECNPKPAPHNSSLNVDATVQPATSFQERNPSKTGKTKVEEFRAAPVAGGGLLP